jgi:hypothetical protein
MAALTIVIAWDAPSHANVMLRSRVITLPSAVTSSLIVGRAVCNDRVWLLTENRELVDISPRRLTAFTRPVRGFDRDDRPWGLACLSDGSLWTLASPRVLTEITSDSRTTGRTTLRDPAVALFGVGDRLLIQVAPPVVSAPLLASAPPRHPAELRPWPGLVGRAPASRTDLFTDNLVTCGMATGRDVPCWFANDTLVTVSDGLRTRRVAFPFVEAAGIDRAAPIRDLAMVSAGRAWVLATSTKSVSGRRSGGRLFLSDGGREVARIDVAPEARMIVSADEATCLLLTVKGHLLEVGVR